MKDKRTTAFKRDRPAGDALSDPTTKDDEAALATKVEKYRQHAAAREAEITGAILKWLQPRDSAADNVCITRALLGIALDRHVEVHGAGGFDLIESAYRRAVNRWRGTLQ